MHTTKAFWIAVSHHAVKRAMNQYYIQFDWEYCIGKIDGFGNDILYLKHEKLNIKVFTFKIIKYNQKVTLTK